MGGARALRFAERLRLSSTSSVAGGWTMAWSTRRPPHAHARPSTSNTRHNKSAQACHRDLARGFFVSRVRSSVWAGGTGRTRLRNRCLGASTPW